jgi:type III pantothenate kinase
VDILIGDIGNTSTKLCLYDSKNKNIKKIIYFKSINIKSKIFLKKTIKKIINNNVINKICLFSSVVPNYELILKKFLKKFYKIKLIEIQQKNIKKIVKINFKSKKQVGSDRIANAVGVFTKYKSNCIVLDFGTATTFDVVKKNGIYIGGVIAPGVSLSLKSLVYSAEKIPPFSLKKQKKIIGKNTIEALRSGFYWGYSGLINNIILKIEKETKKKHKVIFTGGYADLFKTSIVRAFKIDKNITIKGIIKIFEENKKHLIK